MATRWVIQRKADGLFWTADAGRDPWMLDMSEARPIGGPLAGDCVKGDKTLKAVPVLVTIKPAKRRK